MPEAAARSAEPVVRDLVQAWNSHDVERICGFFHQDFENWQLPLPAMRGLAAYRRHLERWFGVYPDLRLEIDRDRGRRPLRGPRARSALTKHPTHPREDTMLIYIEYISRRPGVALEAFHKVAGRGQHGWAGDYPDDVLVANLGRSWRLGPEPEYLSVWWTRKQGLDRIDDWERVFRSSEADAFEEPFRLAARIDRAGCYEPLIEPVVSTTERYYLEFIDFADGATRDDARAAYEERQARHSELTLNLLVDRIGRLGPDPRALALWGLPAWAALDGVARDLDDADGPVSLVTAGGYSEMGKETL